MKQSERHCENDARLPRLIHQHVVDEQNTEWKGTACGSVSGKQKKLGDHYMRLRPLFRRLVNEKVTTVVYLGACDTCQECYFIDGKNDHASVSHQVHQASHELVVELLFVEVPTRGSWGGGGEKK